MKKLTNKERYQNAKDAQKRWRDKNRDKIRAYMREHNKKTNAKRKAHKLKMRYGITIEDRDKIVSFQEGRCKICGLEVELVVDHCHKTGTVRAMLCRMCNLGLGAFKDDTGLLQKAGVYLKVHKIYD